MFKRKTDKAPWIPMHPELVRVPEQTDRKGETIVVTRYGKTLQR